MTSSPTSSGLPAQSEQARSVADAVLTGRACLGIELGSTRIKACLIGEDPNDIFAVGEHTWENQFVNRVWTYSLEDIWSGVQAAYADLTSALEARYGVKPTTFRAIGVSAMMHGYLTFDGEGELLVPFRTWRNTATGPAADELGELFGVNIPLRWPIAHLYQAILDGEEHIDRLKFFTTLAGYVHWSLTGEKVTGIGDASGMFPIDDATRDYDADLLSRFDRLVMERAPGIRLRELLPKALTAGVTAGQLTEAGAKLLDPSCFLLPGIPFCPPEGDAGTGMVATNAVARRTGNVSAGTSIFAMVVLERPLQNVHEELDMVVTPSGDPVAMVHCNNGASELAAWASVFRRFAERSGSPLGADEVFETLFLEALEGEPDAGGLIAYNHLAGEPIAGLTEGRPLVVRTPDSRLTLANFMRAQLYSVFGTLALGMSALAEEQVELDVMFAHGGMFRTADVAQRMLAAAINAPVGVDDRASEGGAWGIAVLASYLSAAKETDLSSYLRDRVFADVEFLVSVPLPEDVAGFASYLTRYRAGLAVEAAAIQAL